MAIVRLTGTPPDAADGDRRAGLRVPGRLAGRITMVPDFDEMPEELLDAFEGRG